MKRSFRLSALLVGSSLITTSVALADPLSEMDDQPVQQVAQVDPAQLQQGTSSTSPTAAPEDSSSSPSVPAVTIGSGSSTPGADAPSSSPPEPERKPEPRPFAGSALYTQNSISTGTIFRGQRQDWNPTIESNLFILPRYAFNDALQLRARLVVNYEYTNNDLTTYRNEPVLSDTTLQLFYRKIPTLPLGIQPALALNAGLPTSKLSRSRTLVVAPGATLQLVKGISDIFGGDMMLLSNLMYSHPLYRSRTQEVLDPRPPGSLSCVGGNNCQDLLSGTMNPSNIFAYSLIAVMEWGHWSPALMYMGSSQWAYKPTDATNPVDGTPVGRPEGFEPTTVRQTHYFSVWLDYNFNSWFTGEVGFWNSVLGINGAGQRANIIFDRYQDTRVYIGGSFQLDNLVKAIQGGDHGDAGIVRAKNTKSPMWTF